ncbi:hypothetical protein ACHQM5_020473 [Ranunculus cassubicifolius]
MSSSSISSSSATVRVDKATSDLLLVPDWTINIDICDSINSNHWQAKEVVKALKKRLLHKNPRVQLLALTLLETMIKNCGEYVHSQIAERNILSEMIKIVKKKMDMQVRDKILDLLDSWQEAFGGPGGKYPQYYWAYEELRRSGVEFPQRSRDAAPIFTPPVTNPLTRHAQTGYGMPSNTSVRLDEAMASETGNISLSNLDAMQSVTDLLSDMLQAVNPNDREAVKDEIIVDLVTQCRSNQKKLMQMLSSTSNEELLARGLELNDCLQSLLVKHDAIASGSPLPSQVRDPIPPSSSEARDELSPTSPFPIAVSQQLEDEEEDEDDDFAQLARRRTKSQVTPSGSSTSALSVETIASSNPVISTATPGPHNALALPDPPNPVKTSSKEQDMIDLLSITLSTSSISPHTPPVTPPSTTSQTNTPVSPATQGYPYGSQPFPGYQPQAPVNNYVAPWAQPQVQQQPPSPPPPQPQYPQYSYNYPPPPWATGPVNMSQTPTYSQPPVNVARTMQNYNSFPARGTNGMAVQPSPQLPTSANGPKTFVPSYRLFEDLNVLGNSDGGHKTTTGTSSMAGQSMVGGRK